MRSNIDEIRESYEIKKLHKSLKRLSTEMGNLSCLYCNIALDKFPKIEIKKSGKKELYFCDGCNTYYCIIHLSKCRIANGYAFCVDCKKQQNAEKKQKRKCLCSNDCDELVPITNMYGKLLLYAPGHFKRISQAKIIEQTCYNCHEKDATVASKHGNYKVNYYCERCYRRIRASKFRQRHKRQYYSWK